MVLVMKQSLFIIAVVFVDLRQTFIIVFKQIRIMVFPAPKNSFFKINNSFLVVAGFFKIIPIKVQVFGYAKYIINPDPNLIGIIKKFFGLSRFLLHQFHKSNFIRTIRNTDAVILLFLESHRFLIKI